MEGFFLCRLVDSQSLVIIVVEGVECVSIIRYYFKKGIRLVVRQKRLILNGSANHAYQLTQFSNLLLADALIDGIAFYKIVLDDITCPNAEGCTSFAMNTVANRDDDIKVIVFHFTRHVPFTFPLNL